MSEMSSIAIIGGADGPTAIFISGNNPLIPALIVGIVVVAAIAACFFFMKK